MLYTPPFNFCILIECKNHIYSWIKSQFSWFFLKFCFEHFIDRFSINVFLSQLEPKMHVLPGYIYNVLNEWYVLSEITIQFQKVKASCNFVITCKLHFLGIL